MNYYNEHDPKAAAWLRELMRAALIPAGDVDERSIKDVRATDLVGYTQCHFFAGIGGWPLALRLIGWPDDEPVWTGSCPCQPFSGAGKRKAAKDARHLWPWFRHLIFRGRPATTFGEQVAGPDGLLWLAGVRGNLETLGYAVGSADLCAAGVGAPHRRQRLYWVAHTDQRGRAARGGIIRSSEAESKSGNGITQQRGSFGGMGHTDRSGSFAGQPTAAPNGHGGAALANGNTRGLSDAKREGLERLAGDGRNGHEPGRLYPHPTRPATQGSWSSYDILPFRDGKTRRVESGTFPLADGVPARVGRLRGYGNAIVPQVAAEFIGAWIATNLDNRD